MCMPKCLIATNEACQPIIKSKIPIPRGDARRQLCESSLLGKVTFSSDMSPTEIRQEICCIFSEVIELSSDAAGSSCIFPFTYLQSSGGGTKSLCIPKESKSFVWNAQQVAALGRNSCIYIYTESPVIKLPDIIKVRICNCNYYDYVHKNVALLLIIYTIG